MASKTSVLVRVVERGLQKNATTQRFLAAAAAQTQQSKAEEGREAKAKKLERKPDETNSFCMNMFRGLVVPDLAFPFPDVLDSEQRETLSMLVTPAEKFLEEQNDATKNDERGSFPKDFLLKFAELGALGAVVSPDYGGAGLNNTQMARLAEIVGANDLSLGVTMGAHQSIGYKGIVLYGNEEQKQKYLPDLATGKKMASFCLTEPSCGSDANAIRSRAELSADGKHYVLNGSKIWITNGGIAEIFTVFAQTPVKGADGVVKDKVSAFIVERGFGGLTSGPPEKKMGINCSNTTELHFDNVKIPVDNLIGGEGNGFKVAMNILNNGRFGIPAAMTGCMRFCIQKAIEHATTRTQFGRKIETYGTIQEKISTMITKLYVTESMTYMVSGIMDQGVMDFQLEGAIGKIVGSEAAWYVCDEAIQILGGMGFMREAELERVLRDLRIFRIFEGTNDILRLFVALTGLQYAGGHLRELAKAFKNPAKNLGLVIGEANKRGKRALGVGGGPSLAEHVHPDLQGSAKLAAQCIGQFGVAAEALLIKHGKNIIEQQFLLNRLAEASIDIYSMVCILSRASRSIKEMAPSAKHEKLMVDVFCRSASERALRHLGELKSSQRLQDYEGMAELAKETFKNQGVVSAHILGL